MPLLRTMIASIPALISAGSFTDDAGVKHTWTAAKPTIVVGVSDAYSLFHMGLPASQIKGTYGERASSGSNFGGNYADGNIADHGAHGTAKYDPSKFPADPTPEELSMLAGAADLSPSCSSSNYWCADFDQSVLDAVGWPDLIIEGPYGGVYALESGSGEQDYARTTAAAKGIPIIKLTASGTTRKDYVAVTQRFEELAIALGAADVAAHTRADKVSMCSAVRSFKEAASGAQSRGVRALALYGPYGATGADGEIGAFLGDPPTDQVLLMLEELGMPIMHTDTESGWEYAVTADWSAGTLSATNMQSSGALTGTPVKYPADFFLYDTRVTLDFTSASFAKAWPHPAVTAKQYAYWPSGGHIHSYRHATDILTLVGSALSSADKIADGTTQAHSATECTQVDVIDSETHRTTGLGPGEYACYQPIEYAWCEDFPDESPGGTVSAAVLGGVAAGCAIVGVLVGLVFGVLIASKSSGKAPKGTEMAVSTSSGGA